MKRFHPVELFIWKVLGGPVAIKTFHPFATALRSKGFPLLVYTRSTMSFAKFEPEHESKFRASNLLPVVPVTSPKVSLGYNMTMKTRAGLSSFDGTDCGTGFP